MKKRIRKTVLARQELVYPNTCLNCGARLMPFWMYIVKDIVMFILIAGGLLIGHKFKLF